jgi:hypothetical protein
LPRYKKIREGWNVLSSFHFLEVIAGSKFSIHDKLSASANVFKEALAILAHSCLTFQAITLQV